MKAITKDSKKRPIPKHIRQLVLRRDGDMCTWQGCGARERLNLHHVVREKDGGRETVDNLVTLCPIHHKQMHIEFHAYYQDSRAVFETMGRITNELSLSLLSKWRASFGFDDGYDMKKYLKLLTGADKFRAGQLEALRSAVAGRDTLLVTPTGTGKSVVYQIPALISNQSTIVISPLNALMKDQVESLWSKKIPTTYINSEISKKELQRRYEFIDEKLVKFIFVAPERFTSKDQFVDKLISGHGYFVLDEAHAITTWGLAFRPAYNQLGAVRSRMGSPTAIALTATASRNVQAEIIKQLQLKNPKVVVTGFYKDNIKIVSKRLDVSPSNSKYIGSKKSYIGDVLMHTPGQKTIIFVTKIDHGEDLREYLEAVGLIVAFFHSRLSADEKRTIQNDFKSTDSTKNKILITTSAFGMGIDIPDIRHVIHFTPALSITDYVQQIGRAGRDGQQSTAHLLYSRSDDYDLYGLATAPTYQKDFAQKRSLSDEQVLEIRNKLERAVDGMLELVKADDEQIWEKILEFFGETKPSFTVRYRKEIIDSVTLLAFVVAATCGIIWLLA